MCLYEKLEAPMGSFIGITSTLADCCACITQPCIKTLPGKVELSFLSSEIAVCYIVKKQSTVDVVS